MSRAQQNEPWTSDQLISPAKLASIISDKNAPQPAIISVSPGPVIPHSVDFGPAREQANLDALRTYLKKLPTDADIVLYCGCCPFNKCPNIRPAFSLLNEMGFKRHKLLNLPHNAKTDWIDKGYPVGD
jgi:hypothetical protein